MVVRAFSEPLEDKAPLSFQQEEMLRLMAEHSSVAVKYHEIFLYRLSEDIDPECLAAAVADLVTRHPALRTTVGSWTTGLCQDVHDGRFVELEATVHAGGSEESVIQELLGDRYGIAEVLEQRPLFHARLHRLDSGLLFSVMIHHIVYDGSSIVILWRDLSELYSARVEQRAPRLPDVSLTYAEFARRQRASWPEVAALEIPYWRQVTDGWTGEVAWPEPRTPARGPETRYERLAIRLAPATVQMVRSAARTARVSPFVVLLAATAGSIARVTGERDLLLGTDTTNREVPQRQQLIGHLLNTRITRAHVEVGQSLLSLVESLREPWFTAARYSGAYRDQILRETGVPDVIPVQMPSLSTDWESQHVGPRLCGVTVTPVPIITESHSWRSFALIWLHDGDGYTGTIYHRPAVVDHETADAVRNEIIDQLKEPDLRLENNAGVVHGSQSHTR